MLESVTIFKRNNTDNILSNNRAERQQPEDVAIVGCGPALLEYQHLGDYS